MARRQKQQNSGPAAVLVFVLLMVGWISNACGSDEPVASSAPSAPSAPTTTAAPAPAPVDVATVSTVETPTSLILSDRRRVFVPGLSAANPSSERSATACQRKADLALAKSMLLHKQVTVAPPQYRSYEDAPAGYTTLDVAVDGQDYADTYGSQVYDKREAACPTPTYTPAPSSDTASGGGGGVDVHLGGDHGLPDGALTGGFCARHRWC